MSATLFLVAAVIASISVLYVLGWAPAPLMSALDNVADKAGMRNPDKLGWLDDATLSDADTKRIAAISGSGVIQGIQAGARGNVTRRDFELLRQDRRRARAAYPDVAEDDLYSGTWLNVDLSARVPSDFCGSGNSNGTKVDGKWYLDGGCYTSIVRAEYTKRADAETTKRVLAELKDVGRQKRIAHIKRWGYSTWQSGTGGSLSVDCNPDPLPSDKDASDRNIAGKCVIINGKTKYIFPFDAADWVDPPWSVDDLVKLATTRGAMVADYVAPQPKPWVMKNGSLARGQTCALGRLCRSIWNAEKDDYDNIDIGPDTPASWTLDSIFGMPLGYVPSAENGERRSVPDQPWFLIVSYYGYPDQVSGGWTEEDGKAVMSKFTTGMSYPMTGQDFATLNRGNLRKVRLTQIEPSGGQILKDRSLPVRPPQEPKVTSCVQGGTLMPGQSCVFR